ncbi:MAG TPA: signal peptidase I [Streptosporangiaceae bacterium]|jgi:signal peptidase|nr:signal peptidase I [Streptosporangiaceae bacterium]
MLGVDTNGTPGHIPGHALARPARTGRWRTVLEIFSTAMTVLIAMLASAAIVVAIASHMSSEGQYTVFGHPVLTVLSGSMTPVIDTGDVIIDKAVTASQARHLHVGQIISFRESPGSQVIITHRIIGVKVRKGNVSYYTKGDANQGPDGVLRPAKDIVGVFQHSIRDGGYVLSALHQPLIMGMLLVSIILFFLAGPLFRAARKLDKLGPGGPGSPGRHAET